MTDKGEPVNMQRENRIANFAVSKTLQADDLNEVHFHEQEVADHIREYGDERAKEALEKEPMLLVSVDGDKLDIVSVPKMSEEDVKSLVEERDALRDRVEHLERLVLTVASFHFNECTFQDLMGGDVDLSGDLKESRVKTRKAIKNLLKDEVQRVGGLV